ncbi:Mini-ribonuclease 3 [Paenibacillus chartarius]|uniref:Mini-ribonuclease 3 n=1 Tax=Paenibacillus chartarius TaxID=747481 RepID=A0ABV6DJL0_9BACL
MEMAMDSSLFLYPPSRDPAQLNPLVLAYIGDAVFEVFVRQYVISQTNHRPNHLHRQSTRFVSAKAQAAALQRLMPELSEEERDIVKRGRNAKSGSSPRNTDILDYRHSTAFECLLGYLYYKQDYARLRRLAELVIEPPAERESGLPDSAAETKRREEL